MQIRFVHTGPMNASPATPKTDATSPSKDRDKDRDDVRKGDRNEARRLLAERHDAPLSAPENVDFVQTRRRILRPTVSVIPSAVNAVTNFIHAPMEFVPAFIAVPLRTRAVSWREI